MSDNIVKILSDVELGGSMSFKTNYSGFPTNPRPRTLAVVDGVPYLYTELVVGSGFFTWTPIGYRQAAYLHTQGEASMVWTVTHNFNTENFGYFVYDENHNLVMANITIVDANTFTVNLSDAITGTVVVFSMEAVFTQVVTASDSIGVGTITLRDAAGTLTINGSDVAMQGALTAEIAARIAGDSATLVSSKAYTDSALTTVSFTGGVVPNATTFASEAPQVTLGGSGSPAGYLTTFSATALTVSPGATDLTQGAPLNLFGGNGGGNQLGGAINIAGGAARNGGDANIAGGIGGFGPGGSVVLSGGSGGAGSGSVLIKTAGAERFRITETGALSTGASGTAYGTAGQVLTSNGNAAPTWQVAGGFTGGTIGAITLPSITLGYAGGTPIAGTIQGASGTTAGINSASVYVKGGSQSGGGASLGFGGSLYLAPGAGHALGYHGDVVIQSVDGADRFRITNTGAWSVGAGGSAYGTAGQVLTSNGNAVPTWTTPAAAVSTSSNNTYTKAQRGAVSALVAGSTVASDFAASNNFSLLANQNFTMAFPTNVVAGQSGIIAITQDATGSRAATWASGWVAAGGSLPVLSTAANAVDYVSYYVETSGRIFVSITKDVR